MTQLIIEAGADSLDPIMAATSDLVAHANCRIEILRPEDVPRLQYVDFDGGLPEVSALFRDNAIASAMIKPTDGKWWVMLFRPMFDGEGPPWWGMTVEYRVSAVEDAFNKLSRVPGLKFLSISSEESLDLTASTVTPSSFPWSDSRLIKAAVRDDLGNWVEKDGPSAVDFNYECRDRPTVREGRVGLCFLSVS